jgi:hypothetical protein
MRYLVRYKDADAQEQVKEFGRKTDRTKWIKAQSKKDPMVKYEPFEEDEMDQAEQKLQDEIKTDYGFTPEADEDGLEPEQVGTYGEDDVEGSELPEEDEDGNEIEEVETVAVQEPLPAGDSKRTKVRLTMTAEVDLSHFKERFGYTDEELKNYALHTIVRRAVLEQLEEYGRNTDNAITFTEAKQ